MSQYVAGWHSAARGGVFLLTSLMSKTSGYMENPLRQNFFRAGHAHAGVIVILSLVCQILADSAVLSSPLVWFVRSGVPLSAILISAGFFFSMLPPAATKPSRAVGLIYAGAVILATPGGPTARRCPRKPAYSGVSMTNLLMRKRRPGRRFSSSPTVRRIHGCLDAWSTASRTSRLGIPAT